MIHENRLLILDDDTEMGKMIGLVAQKAGFVVRICVDAEQFFAELGSWAPSHIALDLVMPAVDGVEVLRRLANHRCRARIIITSGLGVRVLESASRSAAERGLDIAGVLPKPFKPQILRELLQMPGKESGAIDARSPDPGLALAAKDFDRALAREEFVVHYQPKIQLTDGRVMGFEALVRWQVPDIGLVYPDHFLPAAESLGKIDDISQQVISTGLDWLRNVRTRHDIILEVNVSAKSLRDIGFADFIANECDARQVDRTAVVVEITESSAIKDTHETADILTRLRIKGFQVAIDDFGIGYSTLSQLSQLPFSELKIDKFFVAHLFHSDDARTLVGSTVSLAKNLGLTTVAEGVENQSTVEILSELGCDTIQGYHISKPLPAHTASEWLDRFTVI
ncbi:MAG TPA: EAL domain-containing response regulator [Noviherbaspirillum sp.]|uniref:EAL domain-containing response regulator n=1 Tax=Noviherbaspirillum sp. TaxID=1926288 RepID=UPI002B460623|nr:EAL domain-containing response regulator [Noviherbaspirillum sp.]HJV86068.1 EAL domain-containing response regulator [Noviherbaspirillum sp.]